MISWSSMVGFTAGRYDFSNITRYCSSDSILFALLVLLVFVCYVFPSAVTCPRSSIVMVGTSSNMGITYTHRLEAYKVGGGPGHNGRWEVTGFEQVIAYPSKKNRPTWGGDDFEFRNIGGDEEFLAFESTSNYHIDTYDEHDWENRGKTGRNKPRPWPSMKMRGFKNEHL